MQELMEVWCHGCVPLAGLIRACLLSLTRPGTDEPSAHPWHQIPFQHFHVPL
jgi:hypothetical protein